MRVKRYIVDTMPDAMLKIRKDLGGEAVILSTKKIKVGGFLGMFGKPKLEVIAGVDSEVRPVPPKGPEKPFSPAKKESLLSAIRTVSPVPAVAEPTSARALEASFSREPQKSAAESSVAVAAPQTTKGFAPQAYQRTTELFGGNQESKPLDTSEPVSKQRVNEQGGFGQPEASQTQLATAVLTEILKEKRAESAAGWDRQPEPRQLKEHPDEAQNDEFRDKLLEDIRQMKALIKELSQAQKNDRLLPEPLQSFAERFKFQNIDAKLAESWIDPAYNKWKESGESADPQQLLFEVKAQLETFLEGRISSGFADSTRMVYVAGPTGVGKTTTIAKMAADQIFRKHKKVGFITADTYRISAVEQLRTYASILNVPLEVVQSPGDMKRAMSRLEDCDLIFMDTAGRNYLNELYVAELHSMLTLREHSETCLVLSLTAKSEDMHAITERFSTYGLDKVIFTKLDETSTCGAIFNLLADYPLQLLYLTNGQTVPDDILTVNRGMLIRELLGEGLL